MNEDDKNLQPWIDPELEARVVAWVLGEASPFEIAELQRILAENPELEIFKRRIESTHGLVAEAARPEKPALQLSHERRRKLLETLAGGEVRIPARRIRIFPWPRPAWFSQTTLMRVAAVLIIGGIVATAVSSVFVLLRQSGNLGTIGGDGAMTGTLQQSGSVSQLLAEADGFDSRGSLDLATKRYEQVLKLDPYNIPARRGMEKVDTERGKYADSAYNQTRSRPLAQASVGWELPVRHSTTGPSRTVILDLSTAGSGQGAGGGTVAKEEASTGDRTRTLDSSNSGESSDAATDAEGMVSNGVETSAAPATASPAPGGSGYGFGSAGGGMTLAQAKAVPADKLRDLDSFNAGGGAPAQPDHSFKKAAQTATSPARNRSPDADDIAATVQAEAASRDAAEAVDQIKALPVGSGAAGTLAKTGVGTVTISGTNTYTGGTTIGGGGLVIANIPPQSQLGDSKDLSSAERAKNEDGATATASGPAVMTAPAPPVSDSEMDAAPGAPPSETGDQQRGIDLLSAPKVVAKSGARAVASVIREFRYPTQVDAAADIKKARVPQDELKADDQPFSTFSLHVSDVSFQLAKDALERGTMPSPDQIHPEEFYNAFDYGDPAPATGQEVACRVEQSADPFLQQHNLIRIAMKVAAAGRDAAQPLRLTVLLDTSGSMEREDRAASVRGALAALASLLGPKDQITLIGFARQPRLLAEALPGDQAGKLVEIAAHTPSDGGTNLEQALKLAGELADRQYSPAAQNRIVLLTDGAANLGNADPSQLAGGVEKLRQKGISFDACGVGASGLNDDILEALTRKGNGRYYFLNKPEDADAGFARQLAGAFRPAAENVKVQVRFNPARVGRYRLLGFEQDRLKKEDFRNDQVAAAQLAAAEAGVALYQVEPLPEGEGEIGEVFIRFRDPVTGGMVERSWTIPYDAHVAAFDQASSSLQLAGVSAMLAEKLRGGPAADAIDLSTLAPTVDALRGIYSGQARVQDLVRMFKQVNR